MALAQREIHETTYSNASLATECLRNLTLDKVKQAIDTVKKKTAFLPRGTMADVAALDRSLPLGMRVRRLYVIS